MARLFEYRRAGAVVVDGEQVLLVSLRPPGEPRWWHFPGGGIEVGETPEEAARRELHEETGLVAVAMRPLLRAGVHGGTHDYFLASCDDLRIGAVTGPELVEAKDADFRAEWVPIAALATMPVWPRCVAEYLAAGGHDLEADEVPWFEDDRQSWEGVDGLTPQAGVRVTCRVVIFDGRRVAVIERALGDRRWATLPGGGVEPGESVDEAAVREAHEELGLDVRPIGRLAVAVVRIDGRVSLQTFVACEVTGGVFGTGTGEEYTAKRAALRGEYRPSWSEVDDLPPGLRPAWLVTRLPRWLEAGVPARPERFCEFHDG